MCHPNPEGPLKPLFGPWLDFARQLRDGPRHREQIRHALGLDGVRFGLTAGLLAKSHLITGTDVLALTPYGAQRLALTEAQP